MEGIPIITIENSGTSWYANCQNDVQLTCSPVSQLKQ